MSADGIAAFWEWWKTASEGIAGGFKSGGLTEDFVQAVSDHVHAIHPGLDWEFGPGLESEHHLCLSGKGNPTLRVVAERWRRKAPARNATWEFHASRQPHRGGGLALEIGGHKVALDDAILELREDDTREKLDVRLFHPVFSEIDDKNLRIQITFIALDTTLGEDDVERWVGAVELADASTDAAVPLPTLRDRITQFRAKATGDKWIILRGEREGRPVFVTMNAALKRVDHLVKDTHVELTLTLASPTSDGLTTKEEADVLNRMQDELTDLLGDEGAVIGRETGFGKRVLHYHVMEGGPAAAIFGRWRARHSGYEIEVAVRPDPLWDILDRWR
ncbi:hypothetical protein BH09MYX1_BH09MYX1_18150 [soil metagenome]